MSALKKALRSSFRRRHYSTFEEKENDYIKTSESTGGSSVERKTSRKNVVSSFSIKSALGDNVGRRQSAVFRRGSQLTRSVRYAVGHVRQKLRTSAVRQKALPEDDASTPVRSSGGRYAQSRNGRDVDLYSPFHIETPGRSTGRISRRSNIRTVVNMETPTRLRREVEALTANMLALSTLTPTMLQSRKSPPLTNGSLKTPRAARRRISTSAM